MLHTPAKTPLLARVMKRVKFNGDCLEWQGPLHEGYGHLKVNGRMPGVHRVVYGELFGEVPKGLVIDHLCRNRACCNPSHLEVVTNSENVRRGNSPFMVNARKTHCKYGHALTGDNLYITPVGERRCRTCMARIDRQQKAKRRALKAAQQ